MVRIPVSTAPRPYDVIAGNGLLACAGEHLRKLFPERKHVFLITVRQVLRPWGKALKTSLNAADFRPVFLEVPDGEPNKKIAGVERLAEKLLRAGADRNAIMIAFGGGMVGDLAGLTASLYMRGVELVHVPTTVLAQVDSSIGGKTAVNLREAKNILGTFYQPAAVFSDIDTLSTLSERQFRSGLYEALKAGMIGSPALFRCFMEQKDLILARDAETLGFVIVESIRVKARIVVVDERESGMRRVLNLGHTIGHALEAQTRYRELLHGEAVAFGIIAAVRLAGVLGKLDSGVAETMTAAILSLGPLPQVRARSQNVLERLRYDKKTLDGAIHFVIPTGIGKVEVVRDVPKTALIDAIEHLRGLSQPPRQVQSA
jgi:3-dehydroquinate synthase